ncbi:uroporphyrinogen-III synthase [Asticcacaulis sp. BYS171W]|uniref:Uroporphyrinogen-III synthase n=1 Tax=Asticcacaulis aquaticus TaxID=2984212 RepID=A0ABT5HTG0_9CAUL|nr:uroporphyrinogen-III synthase [Asticcacaulis aquaticus]
MTLVWITRTEPAATVTAAKVAALGFMPRVDPLLSVDTLNPDINPTAFDDLIVTSPNGLEAFCAQHNARDHTVWAVGDTTAEAARRAGFATVHSASGDAGDLLDLLKTADPTRRYLYVSPETPARDLLSNLDGYDVTRAIFYRTVERKAGVTVTDLTHVLLHSPRAATLAAPYLRDATLTVICISDNTARALRESLNLVTGNLPPAGLNIRVAATPDEAAMLDLLT